MHTEANTWHAFEVIIWTWWKMVIDRRNHCFFPVDIAGYEKWHLVVAIFCSQKNKPQLFCIECNSNVVWVFFYESCVCVEFVIFSWSYIGRGSCNFTETHHTGRRSMCSFTTVELDAPVPQWLEQVFQHFFFFFFATFDLKILTFKNWNLRTRLKHTHLTGVESN